MFCQTFSRFAVLGLCGALTLPMAHAQDNDKSDAKPEKEAITTRATIAVRVAGGKHWLGVLAVPIDDALKAQLNLKDRLIVHHVLPETPAGKAGLQPHDILLKFGDTEISNLKDLMKAVATNTDKESKVLVLRTGKETTLLITPGERPDEEKLQVLLPNNKSEEVRQLFGFKGEPDGSFIWQGVGPGVLSKMVRQNTEFPNGLSITVSKDEDKPAQVTARKENKTYETTADKLDILPEEIRTHVERLLRGPQIVTWGPGPDGKSIEGALRYRLHAEQLHQLKQAQDSAHKKVEEQVHRAEGEAAKALRQHIEVRKIEGSGVGDLRKEVESLRKAVEELKATKEKPNGQGDSKEDKDDSDASSDKAA